ncbi:MAG: glucosaminidase domain-containing protein [Bacillota bacterium]|nr:glucosaminidase domain-containing protein [Bacillota bacterium]
MRKATGKAAMLLLTAALLLLLGPGAAFAAEDTENAGTATAKQKISRDFIEDLIFANNINALSFTDLHTALPCWGEQGTGFFAPYPVLDHKDTVYIYSEAREDSFQIFPVKAGDECYLLEAFIDGKWHRVQWNGISGYIPSAHLDLSGSSAEYLYVQGQDMRTITGYDGERLELCLEDAMVGMGEAFARAEKKYGVNALFLISICEFESANGTSSLARNRNNLAGLGGSGNWASFSSFEDCVDYLANLLSSEYLNPESSFFHGFTTSGVCQTYCGGSPHWIKCVDQYLQNNFEQLHPQL